MIHGPINIEYRNVYTWHVLYKPIPFNMNLNLELKTAIKRQYTS